jgi:2-polyprenyl-3-methyl-5-hydroxy-6-metoxy-1,4-benzoquinol methylase
MPENVQACPLCGGRKFARFDRRTFRGYDVVNQICESCGLILQSPRMTDSELDAFYSGQYRTIYQGQEEPGAKDLAVQRMRAAWLAEFIDRYSSGPSRYLDIGSSSGVLLETFQRTFDCPVVGVEPGDAYRHYAEQRGLNIFKSLQDMDQAGERRFDLISLIHVLEHIQDPVQYLIELKRDYLTADGELLIEVPNLYVHDSFEIAHLYSFSRHTLREVITKAGFEIISLITCR